MDFEFEELKKEFLDEAQGKIDEMKAIMKDGLAEGEALDRLMNLAHQLKGAGGSYGYAKISSDAACLEEMLEKDGEGAPDSAVRKGISDLQEEVSRQLATFGASAD